MHYRAEGWEAVGGVWKVGKHHEYGDGAASNVWTPLTPAEAGAGSRGPGTRHDRGQENRVLWLYLASFYLFLSPHLYPRIEFTARVMTLSGKMSFSLSPYVPLH